MNHSVENLKQLLIKLKTIGFFERIFFWKTIKSSLMEAWGEFMSLTPLIEKQEVENLKMTQYVETIQDLKINLSGATENVARLTKEKEDFIKNNAFLTQKNNEFLTRGMELKTKVETLESENQQIRQKITKLEAEEQRRIKDYETQAIGLNKISERIQAERENEKAERHKRELERLQAMRLTWSNHEADVRSRLKAICNKYGIVYIESGKVPFKGSPDNTIVINDEFIVFDAKSPAGESQSNFSSYIKSQVEKVGKYANQDGVRKEVFFVVPTNTLEQLNDFIFTLAGYTAYVVSVDTLEPLILAMRKIEDYEFVQELSPEERENICRVIGRFVHLSKRRIQIDGFFAKQFFDLVNRSEGDLPKEFLGKVAEFEKSEKLNPPLEKRAKQISVIELAIDIEKVTKDARGKGIILPYGELTDQLNKLPLSSNENELDTQ